jgi:PAS domain S-box-containing protein
VRQLADGVAAIARGELDQRIDPGRSDELGRLALAFNEMAAQLRQQRTDLEVAAAALHQRFAELSDLKSYTDHILRSFVNGLVTLDLDGRVVTVNLAAETLTGCAASVLTGRPATEVFHHVPELRDLLLETLRTRVGVPQVVLMLPRDEGHSIPVEVATTPLRGAEGQALGVVAILRDLTPVRQLEEQLRRSDRLAALGTLAAGLAHEIKNPLTSIMTFSRHVARRFDDERFRQRFQSVVPRELERINAIVDGLLRLARPARLVVAPVHLPPLVEQALELYAPQIEARRIRVRREWSVSVPPVPGDAEHLYQAFLNLVANAIDAMEEEGGTLTVRLGWPQTAEGLGAAFRDRLVLEVMDTGSGIKPEETADVFNPFFTTKSGGTGLGLAIAHKIVEDHGGTVTFRSTPGQGTVFTVALPIRAGRRADHPASGEWRIGSQAP